MFKTATNIKLHLLIKCENDAQALLLLALSLWCFCEEGREGSCKRCVFPSSIYIQRRKKREKAKANQIFCHWKIAWWMDNQDNITLQRKCQETEAEQSGGKEFFETFLKLFYFFKKHFFSSTAWWASGTKGVFVKYANSLALSCEMQELPAIISRDSQDILNKNRGKNRLDIVNSSNSKKCIIKKPAGLAVYSRKTNF